VPIGTGEQPEGQATYSAPIVATVGRSRPGLAWSCFLSHDDFERQLLELRKREKAHTHEGDGIAAARRRLPMTEVPPDTTVIGPDGPVPSGDVFERATSW
jgi:predicted dithiol-disulfide oxidoreductase (DUF899 family)